MTDLVHRFSTSYFDNLHKARLFPWYLGALLLGLLFLTAIYPEWLVTKHSGEIIAAGYDGELSPTEQRSIGLVSAIFCLISLVLLHFPVGWMMRMANPNWWTLIFVMTMAIILLNPFLVMVDALLMSGNSLDPSADSSAWGPWLSGFGWMGRIAAIALGAVVASMGVHLAWYGLHGMANCFVASGDARKSARSIDTIHDTRSAMRMMRLEAQAYNADLAAQAARSLADGMLAHADQLSRYVEPRGAFFPTDAEWESELAKVLTPDSTPEDPRVAKLVQHRLGEVLIPLTSLPSSAALLPAAARTELIGHVRWLRERAHFDTILTALKMPNAEFENA
ncbi:MAG: hypothetical protein AAGM84_11430 [Pseudomonadota bacterium]